jgi:hypothetical protein
MGVCRAVDFSHGGVFLPLDRRSCILASGFCKGAEMILGNPTPLAVVDDAIAGVRSAGCWVMLFWFTNLPLRLIHGALLVILAHWGASAAASGTLFRMLILISLPLSLLAVWGRIVYLRAIQAALLDTSFRWQQVREIRKIDIAGAWFLTLGIATCVVLLAFTVVVPILGILCVPLGIAAAYNLPHLGPQESVRRLGRVIHPMKGWFWGGILMLFLILIAAANVFLMVELSFSLLANFLPDHIQKLSQTFSVHNPVWMVAMLWLGFVITEPLLYALAARQALHEQSRRRGVDLAAWLGRQKVDP